MNTALSAGNFIKYCQGLGLHISSNSLSAYRGDGLINPIAQEDNEDSYSKFQFYCVEQVQRNRAIEVLKPELQEFDQFLKFLLKVEEAYEPYARSGGGAIQIRGDTESWQRKKEILDLKQVMKDTGVNEEILVSWYQQLSDRAGETLGKSGDWLQFWKSVGWNKKEMLNGELRRGVEYLQWAVMLKRILQEYLGREVLDVDEVGNISSDSILSFNPPTMAQYGRLFASYSQ